LLGTDATVASDVQRLQFGESILIEQLHGEARELRAIVYLHIGERLQLGPAPCLLLGIER
jgi:hypothetical protein